MPSEGDPLELRIICYFHIFPSHARTQFFICCYLQFCEIFRYCWIHLPRLFHLRDRGTNVGHGPPSLLWVVFQQVPQSTKDCTKSFKLWLFQVWLHGHQWKCVRSDLDALQAKGRLVRSIRPQSSQTSQNLQGHQVSLQHGDSVNDDDDDGFNVVFFQFWCTQRPNTFALALPFLTSATSII